MWWINTTHRSNKNGVNIRMPTCWQYASMTLLMWLMRGNHCYPSILLLVLLFLSNFVCSLTRVMQWGPLMQIYINANPMLQLEHCQGAIQFFVQHLHLLAALDFSSDPLDCEFLCVLLGRVSSSFLIEFFTHLNPGAVVWFQSSWARNPNCCAILTLSMTSWFLYLIHWSGCEVWTEYHSSLIRNFIWYLATHEFELVGQHIDQVKLCLSWTYSFSKELSQVWVLIRVLTLSSVRVWHVRFCFKLS